MGDVMGTEYELYKSITNERYDLGKGMWSNVFNTKKGVSFKLENVFKSERNLYYKLLKDLSFTFDKQTTLGYFSDVAHDIFEWCADEDVIFYDCEMFTDIYHRKDRSLEQFRDEFPYTGTRHEKAKKIIKDKVPENWFRFHHAHCGTVLRGCHKTECPKNVYELTGKWIGPKFDDEKYSGGLLQCQTEIV
jgi:hypothetical protein